MVRTRLAWAPAEQELRAQQYPTRADEQRHYAPWGYTSGLAQAVIDCNGIRADFRPCELSTRHGARNAAPRRTAVVGPLVRAASCATPDAHAAHITAHTIRHPTCANIRD